jgi:hypothetical protein
VTDNASLVKRKDSRAATGRAPAVPAKAKAAIAVLLAQPEADLEAAAKAAGLNVYRLRQYLKQSHVRAYFEAERKAILDAICAGNPTALKDIRDTSGNAMARVNAVRALEVTRNEAYEENRSGRGAPLAPGVVIVIEQRGQPDRIIGPPAPPVIEARPDEFGPTDEA